MARAHLTGLGLILLLFAATVWAQIAVPELSRRVTDLTATLSAEQAASLENRLATFEADRGSQIAVLIVPTTQPEDIAQFGIRVADAWKIGRAKVDDGVILIVAKDDHKLRLEVGYGLEGAIPDAVAKRVISETITPLFKAGDYYGGIDAGVTQLMKLIEGESLPPPAAGKQSGSPDVFLPLLIGGVVVGFILSIFMGRPLAGIVSAVGTGLLAWLLIGAGLSVLILVVFVFFGVLTRSGGGGGWSSGGGGFGRG
ncbi:MAG: YgcG family protein, partial [Thiobacillaceae bacterium]